jgi:hypothetical protein
MSSIHSAVTNKGTVTSFLPVTSTFTAPDECSSTFVAHGTWESGAIAYAFDANYGLWVSKGLRCNPPEFTVWWNQVWLGLTESTTMLLGPIVCPSAYTTATTTAINSESTLVGCCPS